MPDAPKIPNSNTFESFLREEGIFEEVEAAAMTKTERLRAQLWPKTPNQEPAKIHTVKADAQMDRLVPVQGADPIGANQDGALDADLFELYADRATPFVLESATDEQMAEMLADQASPWVLTKMGRIQDLTEEDLEGFEFLPVEHEPDDAAVVANTIQDMSLEEKIALGRSMLEGVESHLDEPIEGGPFFGEDDDDDLPTPIASYDAYVLSHRFKDVMAECETGGNLHNLVSSANVEDDDVAYLADKAETPAEKACIELAAQLSPGERLAAWLIANEREAEATRHGFDARNMPQMAASELRAFIDSLDGEEEDPDVHH